MKNRILLIVDAQKQFADERGIYKKLLADVKQLTKENHYDKIFATIFNQTGNPNYENALQWGGCKCCTGKDSKLPLRTDCIIIKNGYGIPHIERYITKDDVVDVMGGESDACLLATCFQLWDMGVKFTILSKYIWTNAKAYTNEDVLNVMRRNFGAYVN